MLRKSQAFGQSFGETEKSDSTTGSRLLASSAYVGAATGGIVAMLNGAASIGWIPGMTTLGAFLAIVTEIADQALYQQSVR